MQTKNYVIRITSDSKEHTAAKKVIENVFKALNKDLAGEVERYVEPIEIKTKSWGYTPLNPCRKKHLHF